jgi:hypothetical protein
LGNNVTAVRAADFDGDGKLDVVANTPGKSYVYYGDGAGAVRTPSVPLGVGPGNGVGNLAVGDFNRDGTPDVATVDTGNFLRVFLNTGTAFSIGASPPSLGYAVTSLVVADFDGNGKLDLAAALNGTPTMKGSAIWIGLGDGTGVFNAATPITLGVAPVALAVADLNADGWPDLAAVSNGSTNAYQALNTAPRPSTLQLTGSASAAFTATPGGPGGWFGEFGLAAADFDRNGILDLMATAYPPTASVAAVALGSGSSFTLKNPPQAVGASAIAMAVADVNLDGIPDSLLALGDGSGMRVCTSPALSTISCITVATGGITPSMVAIGDLDRDGKPDAVVGSSAGTAVAVMINSASAPVTFTASSLASGTKPLSIALGDFNEDGKLDLVVGANGAGNSGIALGNGAGGFGTFSPIGVGSTVSAFAVAAGDVDHDGHLDVVLSLQNGASKVLGWMPGQGDGTFGLMMSNQATNDVAYGGIALTDMDRDGDLDAVVATLNGLQLFVFDRAARIFSLLTTSGLPATGQQFGAATGDFNRDGKPDVAAIDSAGGVWVYSNTSN